MATKYYISYEEFFKRDKDDWKYLEKRNFYTKHKFTDQFLIQWKEKIDWDCAIELLKLSEDVLEQVCDVFTSRNWGGVSYYCTLSDKFIKKHKDKLNWRYLTAKQNLSEKMLTKFADRIDWEIVSKQYKLSEEFMRKFPDKLHWTFITENIWLDESFIREVKDYINWEKVFKKHKSLLYLDFIREYWDDYICNNTQVVVNSADNCCEEIVHEFKDRYLKVCPHSLLSNHWITDNFIIKYKEYFDYNYVLKYRWTPGFYSDICVETRGFNEAHAKQLRIERGWE